MTDVLTILTINNLVISQCALRVACICFVEGPGILYVQLDILFCNVLEAIFLEKVIIPVHSIATNHVHSIAKFHTSYQ